MHFLITAFYLLFALAGFDGWAARTIATHVSDRGTDVLYSETSITPILARFSCVDSATGRCHYRLFPSECAHQTQPGMLPGCTAGLAHEFVLVRGDSRQLSGLGDDFDFCVSAEALPSDAPCKPQQRGIAGAPQR